MIVLIVLVACRLDPEVCRPWAGAGAIRPPASGPLTPGRGTV